MGVLNANEDSFFANSRFDAYNAQEKLEKMIQDGAHIIDIGAVSSRPGSLSVPWKIELQRTKPIIDLIAQTRMYEKVKFSLDSYEPEVLKYALDKGFSIINDITGLNNDEVARLAARYEVDVVIMHMQNDPTNMQNNPKYDNVVLEVEAFFKQRLQKAQSFGCKKIILDVGIGFGKTLEHNLQLLKHLEYFQALGCEILIGASRKSMINKIITSSIEERLPGTLAIHLEAVRKKASIVRCHDVKEHVQAFNVQKAIIDTPEIL
jgi:dihydropteroate synthase